MDDLRGPLAGEDEQAVGRVVVVDVELDGLADGGLAAPELLEREHALAAPAGHLDEHVVPVNADDDAGLLAAAHGPRGARLVDRFGERDGLRHVEAGHRRGEFVLDELVEFAGVRLRPAEVELRGHAAGVERLVAALRPVAATAAGARPAGARGTRTRRTLARVRRRSARLRHVDRGRTEDGWRGVRGTHRGRAV